MKHSHKPSASLKARYMLYGALLTAMLYVAFNAVQDLSLQGQTTDQAYNTAVESDLHHIAAAEEGYYINPELYPDQPENDEVGEKKLVHKNAESKDSDVVNDLVKNMVNFPGKILHDVVRQLHREEKISNADVTKARVIIEEAYRPNIELKESKLVDELVSKMTEVEPEESKLVDTMVDNMIGKSKEERVLQTVLDEIQASSSARTRAQQLLTELKSK